MEVLMNNNIKKVLYISLVILIVLLQFSLATFAKTDDDKCAWGFSRGKNHSQPNLDSKPLKILEKYDRYCYWK